MPTDIGLATLLGILVLPAMTFALAYSPLVTYLTRSLISPYAKADVRKRFNAALVDGLVVISLCLWYWTASSRWSLTAAAGYLLLRDAIGGQSIGKLLFGLVVIDLMSGRAVSVAGSARRNLLLLAPGANVVAIFLEARTIAVDPQGQRLGDRLAHTQVVEGAGARDLVKSFQSWLMSLGRGLGHEMDERRRVPGRVDRHAESLALLREKSRPLGNWFQNSVRRLLDLARRERGEYQSRAKWFSLRPRRESSPLGE